MLPKENSPWIPEGWESIYDLYAEHDAWYSGDRLKLQEVYERRVNIPTEKGRFWSRQIVDGQTKLHIPIAGEIAAVSADLLFSESPRIRIPEADSGGMFRTQERLEEIIERGGVIQRIHEGAEACSAMGGVFLKVNWDANQYSFPILSIVQADNAIPEFQWGFLKAVTFWRELTNDGYDENVVYRHIERHEIVNGKAYIFNALYRGTPTDLGKRLDLADHPDTAHLKGFESINTQLDTLPVRYVPNIRPNRRFRNHPIGHNLGISDYSGAEGAMDSLDETWTSWIRDIQLGKGRIIVNQQWLSRDEITGEFKFDGEQEVFTTLNMDPVSSKGVGFTVAQFDIRMEQHRQTALELLDRIITNAGYSPQTFGLRIEGRAESGTALNIRERRTTTTQGKKAVYWKKALEDILEIMLKVDAIHLKSGVEPARPNVEIKDTFQSDIMAVSTVVDMISRAEAASIETKVRMIHPDWTEEQVQAEVDRIKEERGLKIPDDPIQVGVD